MTITREKALSILKAHGWTSKQQTAVDRAGNWVKDGSSFDENLGIKPEYTIKEIKHWLGY